MTRSDLIDGLGFLAAIALVLAAFVVAGA